MARTPSNMITLGTIAPDFNLVDTKDDSNKSLEQLKGEIGTVVLFICNHCPFVIHVNEELVNVANEYSKNGFGFIAISSNDIENYPQDAPDKMKQHAIKNNYPFPYLYDESQEVSKAYDAACTPDIYVFDKEMRLVYRGQLDDSRPGNGIPVTGSDLRHAMNCLLEGKENNTPQKPSIGCNIKWKS